MKYYLAANFRTSYQAIIDDWCIFPWKKLWIILNAADLHTQRDRVDATVELIESLSCEVMPIDLRNISSSQLESILDDLDILFVNWWNMLYLKRLIIHRWLYNAFMTLSQRSGLTYIGSSAGSVIMWQDIWWSVLLDKNEFLDKLEDLSWFWVVPYSIIPHRWREKYTDVFHEKFMESNFNFGACPLLLMNDSQIIIVDEKQKHRVITS